MTVILRSLISVTVYGCTTFFLPFLQRGGGGGRGAGGGAFSVTLFASHG